MLNNRRKLSLFGVITMLLFVISITMNSATTFAISSASANGMSEYIYSCVVRNYNRQTGNTDTAPLFTDEQLASIKQLVCLSDDYAGGEIANWSEGLDRLVGLEKLEFGGIEGIYEFMTGTLDLSFAPNLKVLVSSGSFSYIDTSNNPELVSLSAFRNGLTSIDISKNPKLEDLVLSFCNITSIDLSNNPKLKYLDIRKNKLSSVDVTKNTLLEELHIDYNENVSALNVSDNPNLKELTIIDTSIKELTIKNNPKLETLGVNGQLVETSVRAQKKGDDYIMDISRLPGSDMNMEWVPDQSDYYQYDAANKIISFSDINSVLSQGGVRLGNEFFSFVLRLRPVNINVSVLKDGKDFTSQSIGGVVGFVGDTWNTNDYLASIDNMYKNDLESTVLKSVIAKIKMPGADEFLQIGKNDGGENALPELSGVLGDIEMLVLTYDFGTLTPGSESPFPATPNTGVFVNGDSGNVRFIGLTIGFVSLLGISFILTFIAKRVRRHYRINHF